MIPFIVSALSLSLFAAVTNAQPSTIAARSTRAVTLVGDDIYLYGGSGSDGSCYSDLFTLHLDPSSGWVAGKAPWTSIKQSNPPVLGVNSWAVASTDGSSLMFYGQTLCPSLQDNNTTPPTYSSTSASVQYQNQHGSWSQATTETGVLGPRLVPNDEPVPVQVVDTQDHIAYTFVYDAFNAQLGMQLWSFPTSALPSNIAQSGKNKTMVTSQPTTPASNSTTQPAEVVLAPYMDPGNAVYLDGKIIVVAGGRQGLALTGDNVDPASGLYKTDRCFVYTISTGLWTVQPLTAAGGSFPLSRSMAALVAVGTKIYMHGGNTTATIPTTAYAQDLWILNTQTWEWTSGPDSLNGRALHTLINYQNTILSVSGFEFETSKAKAAQNGFIMVYDLDTNAWSAQFGTIQESFFKKHGVVLIVGSLAGFLVLVVLAAVATRLWRKHTGRPPLRESRLARKLTKKFTRKFNNNNNNNKPFFAGSTTSVPRKPLASSIYNNRSAATTAAHLSGMSNVYPSHNQRFSNQGQFEQHIDLSALPRVDDSGAFDRDQSSSQSNPYSSMQHVPLMSDNALENQGHELDPYHDDRGLEEKDPRRLSNTVTPNFNSSSRVSEIESISYPGQLMTGNNGPASTSG